MGGKRWMVLLVAAILAVFAGTGQAAVIYANIVISAPGVTNSEHLTGAPDLSYAKFTHDEVAILGFAENFTGVSGADAKVYVELFDFNRLSDLTVSARTGGVWSDLTFTSTGGNFIGWWAFPFVDATGNFNGLGSAQYDQLRITYNGTRNIDVDAVSVDTRNGTGNGGPTSVPEAGALLLFGTGLVGLVGYRRVRRMM